MKNRSVPMVLAVVLAGAGIAFAQMSNGSYTLTQEMVSSGGERVGGGNPMMAQTVLGLPASGAASNAAFSLVGGITMTEMVPAAPITMTMTVTGTVDDAAAAVTVNGAPAAVSGNTFTAPNVLLVLGPNTVTASAKDGLGNTASRSMTVYLDLPETQKTPRFSIRVQGTVDDSTASVSVNGAPAAITSGAFSASVPLVDGFNTLTATARDPFGNAGATSIRVFVPMPTRPPARPTVGTVGNPIPALSTQSSLTIGGTKTPGTSIWINGAQVVARDDATTWTATVALIEGDNELVIVAKDATGAASAEAVQTVVVDTLPPVVTFQPPQKTNFNPLLAQGSVDDSLTVVTINGRSATRAARAFELAVPLSLGPNTMHLVATSPNGYTTQRDNTVTLGTIPTIQTAQPSDGAKRYVDAPVTLQVTATDQESDPIQTRFLIDGAILADWNTSASQPWTPTVTSIGRRRITVNVRDGFGGSNAKEVEVYVVRKPISP